MQLRSEQLMLADEWAAGHIREFANCTLVAFRTCDARETAAVYRALGVRLMQSGGADILLTAPAVDHDGHRALRDVLALRAVLRNSGDRAPFRFALCSAMPRVRDVFLRARAEFRTAHFEIEVFEGPGEGAAWLSDDPPAFDPLARVLATSELARRSPHRDLRLAEARALVRLYRNLAESPREILQKLSDSAMALCGGESAGISLLEEENGRRRFRWHAVSGKYSGLLWTTMPGDCSPCGAVAALGGAQLMIRPERCFAPLQQVEPAIAEVLLAPFHYGARIVGTLWLILHDRNRSFDREDLRVVSNLAKFADLACDVMVDAGLEERELPAALRSVTDIRRGPEVAESPTQA